MGEITIKIPNRKNRYYVFTDADRAEDLIEALDKTAIRVKTNPASVEELEYISDAKAVDKALAEHKRTGKTYRWADVKAELGL